MKVTVICPNCDNLIHSNVETELLNEPELDEIESEEDYQEFEERQKSINNALNDYFRKNSFTLVEKPSITPILHT
jgi:uncharacterized Zn finger protein (UPF0148 family)